MHSNKRWPVFILSIALILGILQPYPIVSAESEQTYENYDENDKDAAVALTCGSSFYISNTKRRASKSPAFVV